jgi:hypothetical protein
VQRGGELALVGGRQWERVLPQLDDRVVGRALVLGCVALFVPKREVEGGVARPGLQHSEIEVHAVQLGAHELIVDALLARPGL